jgi:8-oxo-dGTP pyrophosphatase MutT (NUDIX family)
MNKSSPEQGKLQKEDLSYNESLIKKNLFEFNSPSRIRLQDDYFVSSAVLFSILPKGNEPFELVLIHRTNTGRKHRGEMSFPGGKFEPKVDTTLMDTAFREAEEEVGVSRDQLELLGCLNDFPTMTKYIITPFIARIDPRTELNREEKEVQEILKVPIDFFINRSNFHEKAIDVKNERFPIFYYNYYKKKPRKHYLIWGATAHMIVTFINRVYKYQMSELGIQRFNLEKIRSLKDFFKYKNHITSKLK